MNHSEMDAVSRGDPLDTQKVKEYCLDNSSECSAGNSTVDHHEEKEVESEIVSVLNPTRSEGSVQTNSEDNADSSLGPSDEGRKEELDKRTKEDETKLYQSRNESGNIEKFQEPTTYSICHEKSENFIRLNLGGCSPANSEAKGDDENEESESVNTEDTCNTSPNAERRNGDPQKRSESEKPDIGDSQEDLKQMKSEEHGAEDEGGNMDVDEEPCVVGGVVSEPKLADRQMSDSSCDEDDPYSGTWASRDTWLYRVGYPVSSCILYA